MSLLPDDRAPQRLDEQADEIGALLRSASREFSSDLNESAGWTGLQKRRTRRRVTRMAVGGGLALIGLIALTRLGWHVPEAVAVAPEVLREPAPVQPVPSAPIQHEAPRPASARSLQTDHSRALDGLPATEKSCNQLSKAGHFRDARDCFEHLAQGNGLSAQMALLQVARLTAGPLGAPSRALAILEQHQVRFPSSPLRGEVEQLRVSTLSAAGDYNRALQESESLLGTEWGRPLSAELHLMRGRIYEERLNDCSRAASEYVALLGTPGKAGDEAEFRRAWCLDKLGRRDDARQAYQAYLRRDAPAHGSVANERLSTLEAR